ncbi:hypothetical protein [Solitalea canadensis]|uniref:DUF8192 domain-containing protein n=1 Tax=Solitalea canadensis (strain ATCC 29591 / DSM 3403 / JCM 21819 / LMG 8368 / NBRC 15130 / NCIMB 12057 / USAM 9D) TaxID=929556 RepID=H8KU77_SOLCM|nr:hypothetical protein [Solitalea canadensis]AFD07189.1 hypothetical protein Solca_2135 [Solitalea canadensis DSM 3403]
MKLLTTLAIFLIPMICFGQEAKNEIKPSIVTLFENYTPENSELINEQEARLLKELLSESGTSYDFFHKKVVFVSGSTGSTLVDKKSFFQSNQSYIIKHGEKVSNIGYVVLDKAKWKTCYDAIVFFWVKVPGLIPTKNLRQRLDNSCD